MERKNLWEEIKQGAQEGLEVFKDELSRFTQELERQGKIIKKKMDLSAIQRKVQQSFIKLGGRIYELFEEGKDKAISKDPEVQRIVADIKDFKTQVEAIEDEIIRIKQEGDEKKGESAGPDKPQSPTSSTGQQQS